MKINCPIREAALRSPDATALRTIEGAYSYRDLEGLISTQQVALVGRGISAGSAVAILAENSIEYIALLWALFRLRAVAVPLNTRLSRETLAAQLRSANVQTLFCDGAFSSMASELRTENLAVAPISSSGPLLQPETFVPLDWDDEDLLTVCFTSGSSGQPKGAKLTIANHYYSALGSNENILVTPKDCWYLALPLCHVGGLGILFRAFLAGAAVFVDKRFDAGRANLLIDRQLISHLSLVPTMLGDLIKHRQGRTAPPSLKAILLGGAPAHESLIEKSIQLSIPIVTSYGLTETASQVTATAPGDPKLRLVTSGRVLAHRQIRIVASDRQPAVANTAGEVQVRGDVLFSGYLDRPLQTVTENGWFSTGDLGFIDRDGYLTVTGRKDRMFVSGGENIYPEEIERAALELSGIQVAACIAVPDDRWGQRPVLVIELSPGTPLTIENVDKHLRLRLARLLHPAKIISLAQIPRTAIDKIDYARLVEIISVSGG